MGSDRARTSYDPAQRYRAVVRQQGRVTLEADENEAWQIDAARQRAEVREIVGVCGTPDDGYKITPGASFDLGVGAGTMYVGGERVRLGATPAVTYAHQPDWLTPPPPANPVRELVYLYLFEQEISAVEDHGLLEVALGGPDTAQRLRVMQHVERVAVSATSCTGAFGDAEKEWEGAGLTYDAATARLVSRARLKVGFDQMGGNQNPCEPVAQGGYLGADNQLIRVQIASATTFTWGFDDASFLYRVASIAADGTNKTLTLAQRPLDAFHQPRAGQCVEILRASAKLANGDYAAYAGDLLNPPASTQHLVTTLASAYDPDAGTIVLQDALPAAFADPNQTPVLYVRVWEQQLTIDTAHPVSLGTTGINVSLSATGNVFHAGDYWTLAARPSTPVQVYPERLTASPQPPEGPRRWVCPLAVIGWTGQTGTVLEDCRNPFDDLVELTKRKYGGGCCTVNVKPSDLSANTTLQTIVDKFRGRANATVCLASGVYELREPLRLTAEHAGLTIEACDGGADLRVAAGSENAFLDGMIVLERANSVSLRGLRLTLPQVPFTAAGGKLTIPDPAVRKHVPPALLDDLCVSIGVRAIHCALLAVDDCLFRFTVAALKDVLAIGVFAQTECWGFRLTRTRFVRDEDVVRHKSERPFRMLIGYALAPAVTIAQPPPPPPTPPKPPAPGGPSAANLDVTRAEGLVAGTPPKSHAIVLRAILQDAFFEENLFSGLSLATLILADLGTVAFERNTVREVLGGFFLIAQAALADAIALTQLSVDEAQAGFAKRLLGAIGTVLTDPTIVLGTALVRSYPLPVTSPAHVLPPLQPNAPKTRSMRVAVDDMLALYTRTVSLKSETQLKDTQPAQPAEAAQPAQQAEATQPAQHAEPAQPAETAQPAQHAEAAQPAQPAETAQPGQRAQSAQAAQAAQPKTQKVVLTPVQRAVEAILPFQNAQRSLAGFETIAFAAQPRHAFFPAALRFVANEVDAVVANVSSSAALLVWGDHAELQGSLIVDGNRFRNAANEMPTALAVFVERCAVTGNAIVNEANAYLQGQRQGAVAAILSLELFVEPESSPNDPAARTAAVAVTGNVFRGETLLPDRNLNPVPPAPMDGWDFLNTVL